MEISTDEPQSSTKKQTIINCEESTENTSAMKALSTDQTEYSKKETDDPSKDTVETGTVNMETDDSNTETVKIETNKIETDNSNTETVKMETEDSKGETVSGKDTSKKSFQEDKKSASPEKSSKNYQKSESPETSSKRDNNSESPEKSFKKEKKAESPGKSSEKDKKSESPKKCSMEEKNQHESFPSESNNSKHSSSEDRKTQSRKRSRSPGSGSPEKRSNSATDSSPSPKKRKWRKDHGEKSERSRDFQSLNKDEDEIDQKPKQSHKDDKRYSSRRREIDLDRHSSHKHDDMDSPQKRLDKEQSHKSSKEDKKAESRKKSSKNDQNSASPEKSSKEDKISGSHKNSSRNDQNSASHEKSSKIEKNSASPNKRSVEKSNQCKFVVSESNYSKHSSTTPEVGSPRKKSRFDSKLKKEDSVNLIKQDYRKDRKEIFEYFFGKGSPFSNFHPAKFQVDKITYRCSEQYMMHQKAVTFKDNAHAFEIMRATDPVKMKKLGRQVQNFNADYWGRKSEEILKKGVMSKFEQNDDLKKALIDTFPRILVEAAPRDRLWGIGCGAANSKAHSRTTWRGRNKLGYLLTNVRNEIMEKEGYFS